MGGKGAGFGIGSKGSFPAAQCRSEESVLVAGGDGRIGIMSWNMDKAGGQI
jgi:hypothetical protein